MDPVHPWLDPIETRRMAERLLQPVREPVVTEPDAGFDESFVGFADGTATASPAPPPPPEPVVQPPPAAPATPAEPPAASPPPPPVAAAPRQVAPTAGSEAGQSTIRGPFLDRILRFRAWLEARYSAAGAFILDRDGAVIFDSGGHSRLHFMARSLAMATGAPDAPAHNVHVKVGGQAVLEVIPVVTPYGRLVLGTVVPGALTPVAIEEIRAALVMAATPPPAE